MIRGKGRTKPTILAAVLVCLMAACTPLDSVPSDEAPAPATAQDVSLGPTPSPTVPSTPPATPTPIPGAAAIPVPNAGAPQIPLLGRPFAGDYPFINVFDHNYPFGPSGTTGEQLAWWGARVRGMTGHLGYDWDLPEGTPVLAAGDGEVIRAGPAVPFYCSYLGGMVDDSLGVDIRHAAPNGEVFVTSASHMSRVDVQVGQIVTARQHLGLSGRTGCTNRPHLHFQVSRVPPGGGRVAIDPYGWAGPAPDPWQAYDPAAVSVWLWKEGQAPPLYREKRFPVDDIAGNVVQLTAVRWWGWSDETHPFDAFAEISLTPGAFPNGEAAMGGYSVTGPDRLPAYALPPGAVLREGAPIRVHVGPGLNTDTDLYWADAPPELVAGCVKLRDPAGRTLDSIC